MLEGAVHALAQVRQHQFRLVGRSHVHDAHVGARYAAARKDDGAVLDRDNFGRVGTGGNARDLGVDLLFKLQAQLFGGFVGCRLFEEIAVVFSSEAVAIAVQDQYGVDFGDERR